MIRVALATPENSEKGERSPVADATQTFQSKYRGLKPTATIMTSLRDYDGKKDVRTLFFVQLLIIITS